MMRLNRSEHLDATVRVPGSKSYTQRAMVIAALAEGESVLHDPLLSEDTLHLAEALRCLGAAVRTEGTAMMIRGTGGRIATPRRAIDLGSNGTGMRLLTGMAALGPGPIVLTGKTAPVREADEAPARRPDGPGGHESGRSTVPDFPPSRSAAAVSPAGPSCSGTSRAASSSLRS